MSDTSCHVIIKNEPDDTQNYLNLFDLSKGDVISSSSLTWKEESLGEQNNSSPSSGGKEEEQEYKKYSCKIETVEESGPVIPENITVKVEEYNELEVLPKEEIDIEEHKPGYELTDLKTVEGNNEPACIYPGNRYSNEQRDNTESENGELFKCQFCSYESKVKEHLQSHFNYNHGRNIKLLECDICPYKTKTKRQLTRHIYRSHGEHDALYKCKFCPYESKVKVNFQSHFSYNHGGNIKLLKCVICPYQTRRKSHLHRHIKSHKSDKGNKSIRSFKCDICPCKIFKKKRSLIEHFDRNHTERKKLLKCDSCSYETKVKRDLTTHIFRMHTKREGLFKCDICPYRCKVKENLQKHFNYKHVASMEFSKCTKSKTNLERHINKDHETPAESNKNESDIFLKCDICPYATSLETSLKKHRRKHSLESVPTADS